MGSGQDTFGEGLEVTPSTTQEPIIIGKQEVGLEVGMGTETEHGLVLAAIWLPQIDGYAVVPSSRKIGTLLPKGFAKIQVMEELLRFDIKDQGLQRISTNAQGAILRLVKMLVAGDGRGGISLEANFLGWSPTMCNMDLFLLVNKIVLNGLSVSVSNGAK